MNIVSDEVKLERLARGRPKLTLEQKEASAAAKKEYQKKWYAEHKERAKMSAKSVVARNIMTKRFMCTSCDKCFSKKSGLDIHIKVSKVHIANESKQQQQQQPIGTITNNTPYIEAY